MKCLALNTYLYITFRLIILSSGNQSKLNVILINLHNVTAFSLTLLSPGNYLKCHLILTKCLVFSLIRFVRFQLLYFDFLISQGEHFKKEVNIFTGMQTSGLLHHR